jgi:dienelactone hydrolase
VAALVICLAATVGAFAQQTPPTSKFKDELRMPWARSGTDFIRDWIVAGPIRCRLDEDCLGGEAATHPGESLELKRPDGSVIKWRVNRTWGDHATIAADGPTDDAVGYAHAVVKRAKAGKATLSLASDGGIRAWVNGKQVLSRDDARSWSADSDLVEVDLNAGHNTLLVKVGAAAGFAARVLETGTVTARVQEIAPVILESTDAALIVATDASATRAAAEAVKVEVVRPGGDALFSGSAKRGERLRIDASGWPEGPYEARFSTPNARGLLYVAHLPWYKGNALAKARELAAEAAKADRTQPEGFTLQMLVNMVDDRLGVKLADATGNPWAAIHSPLMEYEELMLERAGKSGRVRAHGFVRLGWIDETDGTPQYCRAYLPGGYSSAKKWPLVLQLHGFNPANPLYFDWWSADNRHAGPDTEVAGGQGVIYIEPHGRGNVQYRRFADADVMRCMAEARKRFSVDENRTYLTGDSMGGWGVWNVSTRHPELFAAIAPIFGGIDYHSILTDEEAARLSPAERFLQERESSWSMADSLINTPIFVHHGDQDAAVNVEWSRWGVRLLQRWGYDIRYREYPGKAHEELQVNNSTMNIAWFLEHVRDPDPRQVRVRSAELRNAKAWWARVHQSARPLDFMVVDAEVVDRNVIRLDTDNVIDIELTPSARLVDPTKPVRVLWNGVPQELRVVDGGLRLTRPGYRPAALHKSPTLPGSTSDFFNTPFAVVVGTTSKDPAMRSICEAKAQGFVSLWRDWQKFEPRLFKDTEISDADIAGYSLILIGGPDANAVTARLAGKLPVKLAADRVVIDGKAFATRDAALQMIYPNPRNDQRYVWLFAATSTAGMTLASPTPFLTYEWDYIINDGLIPAPKQKASEERTKVVSGMFDSNWRFDPAYLQMGDEEVRAKGRRLAKPAKPVKIPEVLLESYAGSYEMPGNRVVEITRKGDLLWAKAGGDELEFVPIDEKNFYGAKFNVWVTFAKDAAGKVTGFTGHQPGESDFEATKR